MFPATVTQPGYVFIGIDKGVYVFIGGDSSKPESWRKLVLDSEIRDLIERLDSFDEAIQKAVVIVAEQNRKLDDILKEEVPKKEKIPSLKKKGK